jgi:hypothetical protein
MEAHDVLGDLSSLHCRDGRKGQFSRQVTGGVDVGQVRLAVVVDGHVPGLVHVHTGMLEPEPVGVRD